MIGKRWSPGTLFGRDLQPSTDHDIRSWFRLWLDDRASRASFFDASKASRKRGINPFTRQPMVYVGEGPPIGELIHRQPESSVRAC